MGRIGVHPGPDLADPLDVGDGPVRASGADRRRLKSASIRVIRGWFSAKSACWQFDEMFSHTLKPDTTLRAIEKRSKASADRRSRGEGWSGPLEHGRPEGLHDDSLSLLLPFQDALDRGSWPARVAARARMRPATALHTGDRRRSRHENEGRSRGEPGVGFRRHDRHRGRDTRNISGHGREVERVAKRRHRSCGVGQPAEKGESRQPKSRLGPAFAVAEIAAAAATLKAVEARSPDQILAAGEQIYNTCVGCHGGYSAMTPPR